jgi:hypothetical protein
LTRIEFGLDRLGSDLVDDVADLELSWSQKLTIGLGSQEPGHPEDVGFERFENRSGKFLGMRLLLGGQIRGAHRGLRVDKRS